MLLPTSCPGCGRLVLGSCRDCWRAVQSSWSDEDGRVAALSHEGLARRLVLGLKYRNARPVVAGLADRLVEALDDPAAVDVVTWAPTSSRRIAERGFDPAELLARAVARRLGKPCRRLLRRQRGAGPQTGKSRQDRLIGPQFTARPMWRSHRVLVVDDVTTTGATLRVAAAALVAAGAAEVRCVAAAATPRSSGTRW